MSWNESLTRHSWMEIISMANIYEELHDQIVTLTARCEAIERKLDYLARRKDEE
jgi:hypothetical protein